MARRSSRVPQSVPLVQGNAARVASIPAPVGGWNARDSIANMDREDAVTLLNMFPNVSSVVLRGGSTSHATGLGSQVETLMDYSGAATQKLFAIAGTSIYDVTSAGAVGAPVVTGLTNARWEFTNVTTAGGHYIYAVNGFDDPLLYDGSTWVAINAGSSPISISNVTTDTLDNILLFKNRVWFIQKNTLKAWYLPTSSVGGAAQVLDLSSIAQHGGTLVAMGTWTIDAGYGVDDNLVFFTNQGEAIVYRGTDPASAATWALSGVWYLGVPVGKRCLYKYGGDILVISYYGLLPLSSALQSDRIDPRVALSDKIQGLVPLSKSLLSSRVNTTVALTDKILNATGAATVTYGSNFGWQVIVDNRNNAVYVNIPIAVGQQQQYVMNTITKSWCQFTGWDANCWVMFNNISHYGGNGIVYKAWQDNFADGANDIQTNSLQAFNYFEARGVKKYFTRARPSIFTNGTPSIFVGVNVDFNTADTTSALSFSPTSTGLWDVGLWDVALWGSGLEITNNWQGIVGEGYCAAVNLKSSSSGVQIQWASTDIVYQLGWGGI